MLSVSYHNPNFHRQQHSTHPNWLVVGEINSSEAIDLERVAPDCELLLVPGVSADELCVHLQLDSNNGDSEHPRIQFTNRGRSLAFANGHRLHRSINKVLTLPLSFRAGITQIEIVSHETAPKLDDRLTPLTVGKRSNEHSKQSIGAETLAAWLDILGQMQCVAAGSEELYRLAAQAVFNPGGLDGCMVLLQQGENWNIVASHLPYPDHGIHFRSSLVDMVKASQKSHYHACGNSEQETLEGQSHVAVVSPIFDAEQNVVAALYGFRSLHRKNQRRGIRDFEAQFVQVIADSLTAGMVRLESESRAAKSLVLLEQTFPKKIAAQLACGMDALAPRQQEVTVLFCDLRGFSPVADRISVTQTYDLLSDAMDRFSNAVIDLSGVVIDFYGDGLSAFWNAPVRQPEHAMLACQTAIEILAALEPLNERWGPIIGHELGIGIGIHSGVASVGNSGSRQRIKYGPRGKTVNIASRLEQLTKQCDTPILISGATAEQTSVFFALQDLGKFGLTGHVEPVDVFAINDPRHTQPSLTFQQSKQTKKTEQPLVIDDKTVRQRPEVTVK